MVRELVQYLQNEFPEGVYNGVAPEGIPFPYIVVEEGSYNPDEGVSPESCQSVLSTFTVTPYALDRNTLEALLVRLRAKLNRPGDVFTLWGVLVGLMRIESEEITENYILPEGEKTVLARGLNIQIHWERI